MKQTVKSSIKLVAASAITLGISLSASAFFSVKELEKDFVAKAKAAIAEKANQKKTGSSGLSDKSVGTLLASASADKCLDLKGKWSGTCDSVSGREKEVFEIEQMGCAIISFSSKDGEKQSFDTTGLGMINKGTSGAMMTFQQFQAAKWSGDGQVLQLEGAFLINSMFLQAPKRASFSAQALLDGADLVTFTKAEGADSGNGERSCRYSRVP